MKNNSEKIHLPPNPPELQSDDTSEWMTWTLELQDGVAPSPKELNNLISTMDATSKRLSEAKLLITVVRPRGSGYTAIYDSFFRVLLAIENQFSKVKTIEGEPRDRWNTQIIFHRKFGK